MMPDLGDYAGSVLSAYAVSFGLIVLLVAVSLWRAKRVNEQLHDIESKRKKDG